MGKDRQVRLTNQFGGEWHIYIDSDLCASFKDVPLFRMQAYLVAKAIAEQMMLDHVVITDVTPEAYGRLREIFPHLPEDIPTVGLSPLEGWRRRNPLCWQPHECHKAGRCKTSGRCND